MREQEYLSALKATYIRHCNHLPTWA